MKYLIITILAILGVASTANAAGYDKAIGITVATSDFASEYCADPKIGKMLRLIGFAESMKKNIEFTDYHTKGKYVPNVRAAYKNTFNKIIADSQLNSKAIAVYCKILIKSINKKLVSDMAKEKTVKSPTHKVGMAADADRYLKTAAAKGFECHTSGMDIFCAKRDKRFYPGGLIFSLLTASPNKVCRFAPIPVHMFPADMREGIREVYQRTMRLDKYGQLTECGYRQILANVVTDTALIAKIHKHCRSMADQLIRQAGLRLQRRTDYGYLFKGAVTLKCNRNYFDTRVTLDAHSETIENTFPAFAVHTKLTSQEVKDANAACLQKRFTDEPEAGGGLPNDEAYYLYHGRMFSCMKGNLSVQNTPSKNLLKQYAEELKTYPIKPGNYSELRLVPNAKQREFHRRYQLGPEIYRLENLYKRGIEVINAKTITMNGHAITLYGIEIADKVEAEKLLIYFLNRGEVVCDDKGQCMTGTGEDQSDIGYNLILNGLGHAIVPEYGKAEKYAKDKKRGIWKDTK